MEQRAAQRAGVIDDSGGHRGPLGVTGLRGHARLRVLSSDASRCQPCQPHRDGGNNHDDFVIFTGQSMLDQQRHVVDQDRDFARGGNHFSSALGDPRRHDAVQPVQRHGVAEDDPGKVSSAQRAVRVQYLRSELRCDLGQRRLARAHNLSGDRVGIDDEGSQLPHASSDDGLPGADPPGQPHPDHRTTVPATDIPARAIARAAARCRGEAEFGPGVASGDNCRVSEADAAVPAPAPTSAGVSVRGTALVAAGMTVSQFLALAQMLVVSRALGPTEFGVFGSLAVFLLLGSTAMVATQVVVARHEALVQPGQPRGIGARPVLAVGLFTSTVTAALAPLLAVFLNFDSVVGLLLISATFLPLTFTGSQMGHLQGREQFSRLGLLYVIATAGRVVAAVTAALIWGTATATAAGVLVGSTTAALIGAWIAAGSRQSPDGRASGRQLVVEIGHAGHALIALYALTNVDVLLARAELPALDAGLYAAGQLVSRAVFFLPQAVLVAAFPRMVTQGRGRAQLQATAAIAALGLFAAAATAALPGLVLGIFAGPQYAQVTGALWIFALAGAGFGVVQVLLYARLAQHDRRAAILMWGGTVVLVALGLTIGERGVAQLAGCAAGVAWTVAIIGLALDARSSQPLDQEDTPTPEALV